MSNLTARNSASLDFIQVFDGGCVTTRRNELIQGFISKLTHDDLLRMAEKARRAYKPVPMFKLPEGKNRWETYGEKATKLAEEVIEQERQNYVHARLDRDKNLIQAIAKSLRCLVWTVDEEGKPTKLKVVVEKVNKKNLFLFSI